MEVADDVSFGSEMFAEYIDWRIEHPADDLMTELLHTEFEDEHGTVRTLTRDEALLYTTVVAGAGNETTTRLIGWAGKILADHPDQRRGRGRGPVAAAGRDRGAAALRAAGPARRSLRARPRSRCTGGPCPPSAVMIFLLGAANRDDRRWDDPERFDIQRPLRTAPHVRARHALLPRRRAGPSRGPHRPRRAPDALPRVGGRHRRRPTRTDVDRARLGDAPDRRAVTAYRRARPARATTATSGARAPRRRAPASSRPAPRWCGRRRSTIGEP